MLAAAAHDSPVWTALLQLLLLLSGALVAGMLFERFRQSAILGYLLAGTVMGPHVFGLVGADSGVSAMAEPGVALLLFAIGLEFSARRLLRLGPVAIVGGSLQVLVTLALAAGAAAAFGLEFKTAVAVGATVALSSTACVLRLLIDRAEIDSLHGRTSLGILLLQDVAVVPLLLLVTMLGGGGTLADIGLGLAKALGLIAALVLLFLLLAKLVLPGLLRHLSMSRDRELLVLLAVILALGSAWAAQAMDLSPALGAFVAGMLLAESPFSTQIRADIGGLRILFITLFFVSVGMMGDPVWMAAHMLPVALLTLALIAGKGLIVTVITVLFRLPVAHAIASGAALAQVGEFGIVVAGIASGNGLFGEELMQLLVSAILLSLFLTPFLVRYALPVGRATAGMFAGKKATPSPKNLPRSQSEEDGPDSGEDTPPPQRFLLIGFGPSGQNVGEELSRIPGAEALVIDMRPPNVELAPLHGPAGRAGRRFQHGIPHPSRSGNRRRHHRHRARPPHHRADHPGGAGAQSRHRHRRPRPLPRPCR